MARLVVGSIPTFGLKKGRPPKLFWRLDGLSIYLHFTCTSS